MDALYFCWIQNTQYIYLEAISQKKGERIVEDNNMGLGNMYGKNSLVFFSCTTHNRFQWKTSAPWSYRYNPLPLATTNYNNNWGTWVSLFSNAVRFLGSNIIATKVSLVPNKQCQLLCIEFQHVGIRKQIWLRNVRKGKLPGLDWESLHKLSWCTLDDSARVKQIRLIS